MIKKHLPNSITLLNLLAGCVAVALAFKGELTMAALVILVCGLLDMLDGLTARLLHSQSNIGKQLDSLADLISFGFAPAAILYQYLTESISNNMETPLTAMLPFTAFVLTAFAALRLAKFNIDEQQQTSFKGLPTPANALFFASIPIALAHPPDSGNSYYDILLHITTNPFVLLLLIALFSFMMVSPLQMFSLKFKSLSFTENKTRYIFLSLAIILIALLGWKSLTPVIALYILISAVAAIQRK